MGQHNVWTHRYPWRGRKGGIYICGLGGGRFHCGLGWLDWEEATEEGTALFDDYSTPEDVEEANKAFIHCFVMCDDLA